MQAPPILTSLETERRELEIVLMSLERTPKLVNLLRYLADRYFEGESDQLTEYNIAIQVFGRARTSFIASDDAIVRVETHRLRKKLKAFYEAEGERHAIHISLPLGTYVPVFSHHEVEPQSILDPAGTSDALKEDESFEPLPQKDEILHHATKSDSSAPMQAGEGISQFWWTRRLWLSGLIAAVIAISAVGSYKIFYLRDGQTANSSAQNRSQGPLKGYPAQRSPNRPSVAIPFRMIAGYTGPAQRDNAGDVWQADQYHREGWPLRQGAFFIARTNNPLIFRYGRAGDFSYDIPLRQGTYELHLYFLQASDTNQSEDAENKTIFNVSINGKPALTSFDIVSDAMGRNIADERVFRDISPAADGVLHLRWSTVVGTPSVSAIQILEGTPHKQLPIRIITQPSSFTDRNGELWHPDNYFLSGRYMSHDLTLSRSADLVLLPVERYGHFSYAFPVDSRDKYTVVLYFTELFFGTNQVPDGDHESRIFRVMCNGSTLLDDFNIYREAGNLHMIRKSFSHLKPTAQGKLNLMFEPVSNYATVSAIEVIDESN